MYEIRFMPKAEKYIKKLKDKNLKELFKLAFIKISKKPYIGQAKKRRLIRNLWIRCFL